MKLIQLRKLIQRTAESYGIEMTPALAKIQATAFIKQYKEDHLYYHEGEEDGNIAGQITMAFYWNKKDIAKWVKENQHLKDLPLSEIPNK